jgi:acetate kinase
VIEAMSAGNPAAALAIDMYTYRMRKRIGSYIAAMNGIDVLLFTAGVGENAALIRAKVCQELSFLGMEIDPQSNAIAMKVERSISTPQSKVEILVIPTHEELMIAREVKRLMEWE